MSRQLRPGYKQTELGVIPQDWGVTPANEICDLVVDCKNRTPPVVDGGDYAVVRTPNVRNGRFLRDELRFTDEKSFREWTARAIPQIGDILITREAPLGEVCLVPQDVRVCLGQRMMLYRVNREKADSGFLLYALMSPGVQSNLFKKIGGSTVGHARVEDIRNLQVPTPPSKSEQEAIADALSDADALIESLEQLFAKKSLLKQGTMQELLTGKKRLPGFCGEWRRSTLGQIISRFSTGLNPRENFKLNDGGNIFYVTIKSISEGRLHLDDRCDLINEAARQKINERSDLKTGDILFSSIGRVGDAYLIPETPKTWNINESVFVLRPDQSQVVPLMLFYLLTSKEVKDALEQGVTGSTFQSIKQTQLKAISCRLPVSPLEQVAIADILSDMDTEIAELEAELAKTRALKQGMMHKLLTGEIRLL